MKTISLKSDVYSVGKTEKGVRYVIPLSSLDRMEEKETLFSKSVNENLDDVIVHCHGANATVIQS